MEGAKTWATTLCSSARLEDATMNGSRVIPYDELAPASSKETAASLWRLLAEFSRAVARDDPIAHRYLLLLRFILANAIALALVGAAAGQGWIGDDPRRRRRRPVSGDRRRVPRRAGLERATGGPAQPRPERARSGSPSIPGRARPPICDAIAGTRQPRAARCSPRACGSSSRRRIAPIRHLANSLVLLGLIGTVVGFIIALVRACSPEVVLRASARSGRWSRP